MVETRGRMAKYWERRCFLVEHGFKYDHEKNAYIDPAGWTLTGDEIYETLSTMTYEVFCAYVVNRPVEGDA